MVNLRDTVYQVLHVVYKLTTLLTYISSSSFVVVVLYKLCLAYPQVNELDFQDSIMVLGFPEELNKELLGLYQENCKEIRSILSSMSMDLPHYHNLEWRFDVQLASRSLQRQTQPVVVLRLHTKDGGVCECARLCVMVCLCVCVIL